jgi:hypothetical protein
MTHPARLILIVAILSIGNGDGTAQTTRPTTMPQDDVSTIRSVLRKLNRAMSEGEIPVITGLFLASDEAEQRMVDADAQMAAALADLHRAAKKTFGAEGAKLITGDTAAGSAQSMARIDGAEIKPEGDTATVVYPDQKQPPFVLKKVEGQWRIPISQTGRPVDPKVLDERLADLAVQRQVVQEVTRQILAKKFETADQAREAWRSRIVQAATSQPTREKN